jgi:predicted PurR-regulated permease PerM
LNEDRTRPLSNPFVARAARWGLVAWSAIGVGAVAYFGFRFVLYPIRIIFPPLVVAMIAVYLLNPVVTALERRGMRRVWGALLVYLVFAAIFGTALYLMIPVVVEQATAFGRAAPRIIGNVVSGFQGFLRDLGVQETAAPPPSTESIVDVLGSIFSFTRGLFDVVLVMILGPILAFYLLVDVPKIKRNLRAMIPARRRREVEGVTDKIGKAIGSYFRGQLLVAAFVAVASSIVLWFVGLPFWAIVGLVTGLFNLVPLIGPFIGAAVAVFIALTTDQTGGVLNLDPGWPLALGSAVALLIVQQIDNHIISPNMIGRTVRLHPVTVMLGLLIGGALLGLWGMLLAIPVIATIKILILHAWDTRMTWPPTPGGEHPTVPEGEGKEGTGPPSSPVAAVDAPQTSAPQPSAPTARRPARSRPPRWWAAVRSILGGRRAEPSEARGNGPVPQERTPAAATPREGERPSGG